MQDSTALIVAIVVVATFLLFLRGASILLGRNPKPECIHHDYIECLDNGCYKPGEDIPAFIADPRLRKLDNDRKRENEAALGVERVVASIEKKRKKLAAKKKTPARKAVRKKAPAKKATRKAR